MAAVPIDPIKLFTEDMRSHQMETRVHCMRRLRTIGLALGPERTRKELIPTLKQFVEEDDEILLIMAENLGKFIDVVGSVTHATCVLEILEILCSVEETVVRDTAVASICNIVRKLESRVVETQAVPIVQRLKAAEWFTSRISACGLLAVVYGSCKEPELHAALREVFTACCHDETPMVRRAAARVFGDVVSKIGSDMSVLNSDVLPSFKKLCNDESDSVKVLAVQACAPLAKVLGEEENRTHLLPTVKHTVDDRSWRIRKTIAADFYALSAAMGESITKSELLPGYVTLLRDTEREVRQAASKSLPGYCELIGAVSFREAVLPTLFEILADPQDTVRLEAANAAIELLPKLPDEMAPHVLSFLEPDEGGGGGNAASAAHSYTTKHQLLSQLSEIGSVLGAKKMKEEVMVRVLKSTQDTQWRVRRDIVAQLPALAKLLGAEYFKERLMPVLTDMLSDEAEAVRIQAASVVVDVVKVLGNKWLVDELMAVLLECYSGATCYLEEITALSAFANVCELGHPGIAEQVYPYVVKGAKSKVPNVRIAAATTIAVVVPALSTDGGNDEMIAEGRQLLETLSDDKDMDVRWSAKQALRKVAGDSGESKEEAPMVVN